MKDALNLFLLWSIHFAVFAGSRQFGLWLDSKREGVTGFWGGVLHDVGAKLAFASTLMLTMLPIAVSILVVIKDGAPVHLGLIGIAFGAAWAPIAWRDVKAYGRRTIA